MSSETSNTDINVVASPSVVLDDNDTAALTCEIQALCDAIQTLIDAVPADKDRAPYVEKEDWCLRWTQLFSSLIACLNHAKDKHLPLELSVAARELGGQATLLHDAFQRDIRKMKTASASQADPAAQEMEETVEKVKTQTPRMSVATDKVNPVSCTRCANMGRPCYSNSAGMVCLNCKRLKARCSLVVEKGKANAAPTAVLAHMAPKPSAAPRHRPAPRHVHAPKDKGKSKAKSTASQHPQPAAGPSSTASVLNSSRKRKEAEIEDEVDSESDEEAAYMAGRIEALPSYISVVDTALNALKEEVSAINGYMSKKRRRL
ncbi:hypothetical protein DEU56DRAFT_913049 [Suillus clintonianus]|uniref:uncharacterized protein n=1 Tax=Suillus clintonianus TaxID=1904413 RepID=UPI001B876974|nr:uncharacterized protein DEU56DRAFT_913049 [Suillus clintonianus]KAG2136471.1 hypothetical protein DEU56DRAFT_913049 [Suillus clintonianus]